MKSYKVEPVYGMISQDGKTFSWYGADKTLNVSSIKTATDIGVFSECPPTMPVIDLRDNTDDTRILSLMWNHTVEESTMRPHWNKTTVCLDEFLATARANGLRITKVHQVQEEATADLHTH